MEFSSLTIGYFFCDIVIIITHQFFEYIDNKDRILQVVAKVILRKLVLCSINWNLYCVQSTVGRCLASQSYHYPAQKSYRSDEQSLDGEQSAKLLTLD